MSQKPKTDLDLFTNKIASSCLQCNPIGICQIVDLQLHLPRITQDFIHNNKNQAANRGHSWTNRIRTKGTNDTLRQTKEAPDLIAIHKTTRLVNPVFRRPGITTLVQNPGGGQRWSLLLPVEWRKLQPRCHHHNRDTLTLLILLILSQLFRFPRVRCYLLLLFGVQKKERR